MNFDFEAYHRQGYILVDDFLPDSIAVELSKLYAEQTNWEHISQVRESHYQHVFSTKSKQLPGSKEYYLAEFDRSTDLEQSTIVSQIIDQNFKRSMTELAEVTLDEFTHRCYKLDKGGHFRVHIDDYIGDIGCIYYVDPDWIWDWGGILHIIEDKDDSTPTSIFPRFNRAMFINHKVFKFPHFVTPVTEFALKPRSSLLIFAKKTQD